MTAHHTKPSARERLLAYFDGEPWRCHAKYRAAVRRLLRVHERELAERVCAEFTKRRNEAKCDPWCPCRQTSRTLEGVARAAILGPPRGKKGAGK